MEVTNDQLISIALNTLGYIMAGVLWMVIYSCFRSGKVVQPVKAGKEPRPEPADTFSRPQKSSVEYINLTPASGTQSDDNLSVSTAAMTPNEQIRRNRAEVIKMARRMLKDNISNEKIKHSLPITEGELALINDK